MRIQKLLIISLVVGSGSSPAFSQTALSNESKSFEQGVRLTQASSKPLQMAQNSADQAARVRELEARLKAEQDAALAEAEAKAAARRKAYETSQAPAKSEEFFRSKKAEPIKATTVESTKKIATTAPASTVEDPLVEILRQKQEELNARESGGKISPVPAPARPVATQPNIPAPTPISPVVEKKKTISQPALDSAAEAQLVEALRKKQAELDAREAGGKVSPAAPATSVVTPVAPGGTQPKTAVTQPAVDSVAEDRLVEALRKKQAELDAKEASATAARPAPVVKQPIAKKQEESEQRIQRIEAEIKAKEDAIKKRAAAKASEQQAVPVQKKEVAKSTASSKGQPVQPSAPAVDLNSKEARLAELLRKYKADEITPHVYHMERAKIVAQPY